ncbi:hypothetical protein DFP98_1115 [Cohnella phaseoli]|uniref:RHS repeat-associated protein n=1 Tax=Cohnella phaseoli TaxID=456490 RepID=A0A3D9JR95_9BACL|nr:hypothetical protein DFP98_1115 [Cohnella phaseoli]
MILGVFFVVVSDLDKRFINEDSYQGQINNPLTLNLYTYVGNNPLTRWDRVGITGLKTSGTDLHLG